MYRAILTEIRNEKQMNKQIATDWIRRATASIELCAHSTSYKRQSLTEFKTALEHFPPSNDTDALWHHLTEYCTNCKCADSTRAKKAGQIKFICTLLSLPTYDEFDIMYDSLRGHVAYESNYKQLADDELVKKFICADNTLLSTQKMRDIVEQQLQSMTQESTQREKLHLMCLGFISFHGNRTQDWLVPYSKINADKHGYYCPDKNEMHLFTGKTQKSGERVFKVHPTVAKAIKLFHGGKDYTWLVPQLDKPKSHTSDSFRVMIQRHYFSDGNPYGFPTGITPLDTRHLYETHIRFIDPMPKDKLNQEMLNIGHSNKTALRKYAMLYKGVCSYLSK